MDHHDHHAARVARLNDPGRLETIAPEVLWSALGDPNPGVIVDIGAGTGLFAAAFAQRAPHAVVYAVDVDPQMLEWMREHRSEVADGRIVPVAAEQTRIPLDDRIADLVATVNVHHELDAPQATYAEAFRLLKSGGQLLVVDWKHEATPKGPPVEARATREEIEQHVARAGFTDVAAHEGLAWHELLTAVRP